MKVGNPSSVNWLRGKGLRVLSLRLVLAVSDPYGTKGQRVGGLKILNYLLEVSKIVRGPLKGVVPSKRTQ